MVINAPIIGGNKLAETHPHEHLEGEDKFHLIHPDTNWQAGLRYAEEIGLGSQAYELITVLNRRNEYNFALYLQLRE